MRVWAHARRNELRTAFENAPEQKTLAVLREQLLRLQEARTTAMKLINDERRYFYPCHPPECPPDELPIYAEVQGEVSRLVDDVRGIWGDEQGEAPGPRIQARRRR